MMSSELPGKKQAWIICGYALFAEEGPSGLKVEVIAKRVGKSKSSFYHYFADLDTFIEALLAFHLARAKEIAEQERMCKNVVPELLNLLLAIKTDLLFSRQLRINRQLPNYRACFEKSNRVVGEAALPIWSAWLGLPNNSYLAQMVLNLSLENFYLQITEETLTYGWLLNYVKELQYMVSALKQVGDT